MVKEIGDRETGRAEKNVEKTNKRRDKEVKDKRDVESHILPKSEALRKKIKNQKYSCI